MNLDEIIADVRPPKHSKTWYGRMLLANQDAAQKLRDVIEKFYDGDPEVCRKIVSKVHLARVVSVACEQHGVEITPEGARTWLRNWLESGRKWTQ